MASDDAEKSVGIADRLDDERRDALTARLQRGARNATGSTGSTDSTG